jgi:hypothetical protein
MSFVVVRSGRSKPWWLTFVSTIGAGGLAVAEPATGRDCSSRGQAFGAVHAEVNPEVNSELIPLDSVAPRDRPSPGGKGAKGPSVRIGVEATRGVPIDVIRRILRQNSGRYRECYKRGLERRPDLQGEVTVRFVIERDGSTSNSRDGGSTLPDVPVIRCMINAVGGLSFPKADGSWAAPEGGTMSVLMHLWLSLE